MPILGPEGREEAATPRGEGPALAVDGLDWFSSREVAAWIIGGTFLLWGLVEALERLGVVAGTDGQAPADRWFSAAVALLVGFGLAYLFLRPEPGGGVGPRTSRRSRRAVVPMKRGYSWWVPPVLVLAGLYLLQSTVRDFLDAWPPSFRGIVFLVVSLFWAAMVMSWGLHGWRERRRAGVR